MSNYGVLVVECEGSYQIVAEVSSRCEALEMAGNYLYSANGHEDELLAPEAFVINRRDARGFFTVREVLDDNDITVASRLLAQIRKVERLQGRGYDRHSIAAELLALNANFALLEVAR